MASVEESELCPVLTVTKAGYADCDGEYELTSWRQTHGRFRQVYKHIVKDRYWNLQQTFGKVFTITDTASTRGLRHDCGIFVNLCF